ncbi:unnamed protein product [Chrysoparadoxa australica]
MENEQEAKDEPAKRRKGCSIFTWTAILFFLFYVSSICMTVYNMANPLRNYELQPDEMTADPAWEEGSSLTVRCYLTKARQFRPSFFNTSDPSSKMAPLVAEAEGLELSPRMTKHSYDLNMSTIDTGALGVGFWDTLLRNETGYLHVFVTKDGASPDPTSPGYSQLKSLHEVVPVTKHGARPTLRPLRYLLTESRDEVMAAHLHDLENLPTHISYWKPEIGVRLVTDFTRWPANYMPQEVAEGLQFVGLDRRGKIVYSDKYEVLKYKPPLYVDEMSMTTDKPMPINDTLSHLPLTISIEPMGFLRWQVLQMVSRSLGQQKEQFGFTDKDLDDMRMLVGGTKLSLLGVTILASALHLLFEFLAMKNDVAFWKQNKSLKGLSISTLVMGLVFQAVIILYLIEEEASPLVLYPSALMLLVEMWKVQVATGASLRWRGSLIPSLVLERLEREEAESKKVDGVLMLTEGYDKICIRYLCLMLLPMVAGFSLQSLVLEKHTGWYSWGIHSLTGAVYTLGFILMTPQLYINYKLKSVAHLPWRMLCYRFLNTFIDDLFAYILTNIPTMHRLSVFRDDFVFLIYVVQRWIYAVDESRPVADEDAG